MKQIDEIMQEMQKKLPHKRFLHTLGVAYLASSLAMAYHEDPKKAMLAGLLHDCAKCLPDEEILVQCKENGLPVSVLEEEQPYLLHGKLGALYAIQRYGILDEQILDAIRFHTTGRPEMTFLEKIIFLADYIEIGRTQPTNPSLNEIRTIAFQNIDQAVYYAADNTVRYITETSLKGQKLDEMTIKTRDYYQLRGGCE